MANLVQRLTGDLTEAESGQKIAIHAFCGAFNEWGRGKVEGTDVIAAFALDAAQSAEATVLAQLWVAAPDRTTFMRVFKDLMYMGETSLSPDYRNVAFILARLQEEVTDQGGTLP